VSRGKYPLLFVHELNIGLLNTHRVTGFKTKLTSYCRVKGASYLYEPEAKKFILELRKVLQKNPEQALGWLKNYHQKIKELFIWIGKANQKLNRKLLSKAALLKLYQQYSKKVQIVWWWCYLPFLLDDAIMLELTDLLVKLGLKQKDLAPAFLVLTFSPKLSLHQQEQIELLKLAVKIKKNSLAKYENEIRNHLKKWGWKNSWCYMQNPLSQKDLIRELKELIKNNPVKTLAEIKREQQKRLQAKNRLLAKFKNKRLNILVDILAEYAFWHSYKMEEKTKSVYLALPFLKALAKSLNLTYRELIELTSDEILQGKIKRQAIKVRLKDSGILMIKGQRRILTGRILKVLKNKIEEKPKKVRSLTGFVAYPGKARGRVVFVEEGVNVLQVKLNHGDILVTPMTTATMVPLIRKAGGIVTNEGGVLCHAAIIAREFKKPCIIGTKFATKIFKTGDMVEVDAEQGIIKKIS